MNGYKSFEDSGYSRFRINEVRIIEVLLYYMYLIVIKLHVHTFNAHSVSPIHVANNYVLCS